MIYKEKFKIGLKDVWAKDEVSNIGILEYLEDIAAYHSDSVGIGINTTEDTHLNWLLLDWEVEVLKRPKYGQVLDIHTWSRGIEKFYAYRDFEIYDEENNLCVIATSKWLLVDSNTEKIARVPQDIADRYQSEVGKYVFKDKKIERIKEPSKYLCEIPYTARRRDIDVIGHMHNLYYLYLAYEALPEEEYSKRPFNHIRIQYKNQIKLGETVICKYAKEKEENIVVIRSEDDKVLHAIIKLSNDDK